MKSLNAKSRQKETPIFRSGFRGGGKEVLAKMDDYFSFVLLNSFCLHSEVMPKTDFPPPGVSLVPSPMGCCVKGGGYLIVTL
nr:MAG TPA: hypothetical protein [Caudoviricetes sp.]